MTAAAEEMHVQDVRLAQELNFYNEAAKKGVDDLGKTVFPNNIDMAGPFYLLKVGSSAQPSGPVLVLMRLRLPS